MSRISISSQLALLIALCMVAILGCGNPADSGAPEVGENGFVEVVDEVSPEGSSNSDESGSGTSEQVEDQDGLPEAPKLPPPEGAKALSEPNRAWIDAERGIVFIDGYVSLQEGMLEMFACPVGTKEHESVVAVYCRAQVAHAALLALGAKTGAPVQFEPFQPPTGTEIDISVRWLDQNGKWQSTRAQDWVKDIKTDTPMTHPWVFAGSGFWKDEESGQEYYMADAGDFICVSNFTTATLDIPAESSQVNEGLLFEANSEKVPPLGTPVRLVLTPKLPKQE